MVESITNNVGGNSLLRAQQAAQTQGAHGVRQAQPQTIINQSRASAVVPVKAQAVPQSIKLANTSDRPLPRGSIIDTLV